MLFKLVIFIPFSEENHKLKKKENHRSKKTNSIAHTSVWCLLLFILFFIIICLVAVYIYYKRNVPKARGTRFKYIWDENKKDKDTFTDCLEWNDEDVCACSDIEEACTGKCEIYDRNYQTHYVADHRICTDDSIKSVSCVHAPKKEEKKRQRFSFFQRSCQKKEKDQENRDRKKILENVAEKKCEKIPQIVQKDQCKCCRCTLNSKDRILREKREIRKWKARRKKEEKRRKKEESKRAKQLANVCFKETCK
ncbi:uncharacterized protein LOC117206920 [Bombus bifarius]|uniref:Uncharacterized protein LOC117206920 n=1 Tax=Bombus bifarius TaxID=103933 RepID=A0A6P8LPD4_9HYME|nr:uncharacterized protein LOC117206920 [Bombus bifarius]